MRGALPEIPLSTHSGSPQRLHRHFDRASDPTYPSSSASRVATAPPRGGAFATHALMHDRRYRNFFLPQRTDVFAGFRSAADA